MFTRIVIFFSNIADTIRGYFSRFLEREYAGDHPWSFLSNRVYGLFYQIKYEHRALYKAVRKNHLGAVQWLLNHGADRELYYPLHAAVERNYLAIAQCLVNHGANITSRNDDETPLHIAARRGHLTMVQWLLEQGVECAGIQDDVTPLHLAAREGHLTVVQYLVERGADVMDRGRDLNISPFLSVLLRFAQLIGGRRVSNSLYGNTPLHYAARRGQFAVVQYLLAQGADIHARNNQGSSPIVVAFEGGHHQLVRYLQRRGAVLPAHLVAELEVPNENQSVHAVSVHVGVAQAASALKARYRSSDIEKAIAALKAYVQALPSASSPDANDPGSAAKRCLPRLLAMHFIENRSGVTLREAMALVWIGLNDPAEKARLQAERGFTEAEKKLSPTSQKSLLKKREEELLQEVIPQWLYEIQRGYNLSKTGVDNGASDHVTCVSGSFNKTIYVLNRRHSLVNIDYVTEKTINAKAVTIANEIFDKLSTEDQKRYAQGSRQEMSPVFVALLRRELPPLLHAEFDSFKAEGLNVNKAIEDVLSAVEYMSIQTLGTMIEKLEEEASRDPIVTAYSSLSADLPASSAELVDHETSRLPMNRL